jgi:PKHD-type hydroxylase
MIHFFRPQIELQNFSPFTYCDDFMSKKECGQVVSLMHKFKMTDAMISESGIENKSIRSTKLCSLEYKPDNLWIFKKLEDAIIQANHNCYGFELYGFHEAIQLMQYNEGDFYDWHMDFGNKQFSNRKLSFSLQLTDPEDYQEGELEFFRNGLAPKTQGTLILFPPFMYHRVKPILKGTRRAMVGWITGNPFK